MSFDPAAYFARIGYTGPRAASLEVLSDLHRLHPAAIAFENLTTLLGLTPSLDIDAIAEKMLRAGRGGYCFEHNTLFAAVLRALGFEVRALAARVLWGRPEGPPSARTHMLLEVEAGGLTHLADVGFGGLTLTAPLALSPGLPQPTPHERFRLRDGGGGFVLEAEIERAWRPLYWFDRHVHLDVDFDVLNHYVATHASSSFPRRLYAARALPDRRLALLDNRLTVHGRGAASQSRSLNSVAALRIALAEEFGIALPDDEGLDGVLSRAAAGRGS